MNWAPLTRIIVRYAVGAVLGTEIAEIIAGDPDLMNVATVIVAAVASAVTERLYVVAKRKGWAT